MSYFLSASFKTLSTHASLALSTLRAAIPCDASHQAMNPQPFVPWWSPDPTEYEYIPGTPARYTPTHDSIEPSVARIFAPMAIFTIGVVISSVFYRARASNKASKDSKPAKSPEPDPELAGWQPPSSGWAETIVDNLIAWLTPLYIHFSSELLGRWAPTMSYPYNHAISWLSYGGRVFAIWGIANTIAFNVEIHQCFRMLAVTNDPHAWLNPTRRWFILRAVNLRVWLAISSQAFEMISYPRTLAVRIPAFPVLNWRACLEIPVFLAQRLFTLVFVYTPSLASVISVAQWTVRENAFVQLLLYSCIFFRSCFR